MPRAIEVRALPGRHIKLRFDDGVEGELDLSDLTGRGVYAAWDEDGAFERVNVGQAGEIRWENGIDLDAEALWLHLMGNQAWSRIVDARPPGSVAPNP